MPTTQKDTSVLAPFGRLATKRWFRWTTLAMLIALQALDYFKF